MDDLIRRSDAIRVANEIPELIENHYFGDGEAERMMKEIPAAGAVSPGVLEQYKWERDTAIAQLAELGIGFGQKKPDMVEVVRCKDCRWRNTRGCPYMNFNAVPRDDLDFCSDGDRKEANDRGL